MAIHSHDPIICCKIMNCTKDSSICDDFVYPMYFSLAPDDEADSDAENDDVEAITAHQRPDEPLYAIIFYIGKPSKC